MHYMIRKYQCLPGDRIVEPKSDFRIVQHHSIYLGQDVYGTDWMIENKVGHGVRLVKAEQYFNGKTEITRIVRFVGCGSERKQAVQKALLEIGKPYNLINYNCEHFANYVQYGEATSEQLMGGAVFTFFCLILLAVFSGKR